MSRSCPHNARALVTVVLVVFGVGVVLAVIVVVIVDATSVQSAHACGMHVQASVHRGLVILLSRLVAARQVPGHCACVM